MSAITATSTPVARPKVHRLPASHTRKPDPFFHKKVFSFAPYVLGGLVVFALLASIPPQNRKLTQSEPVRKASMLPQISVTSEKNTVSKPEAKLALNNAQAMPSVIIAPTSVVLNKVADVKRETIILQGNKESIVGRMARIPMQNEPITEIKSFSEVDNSAGRELLSIINKY